jgi:hypothetical protein
VFCKPQLLTDGGRYQTIVAGNNFERHTQFTQLLDRLGTVRFGRIEKQQKT